MFEGNFFFGYFVKEKIVNSNHYLLDFGAHSFKFQQITKFPLFAGSEISFEHKKVDVWSVDDVIGWLSSLHLSEYTPAFRSQRINGRCLRQCDRSRFTQLGVTRIAHRQIIESALRGLLQ